MGAVCLNFCVMNVKNARRNLRELVAVEGSQVGEP